MRYLTRTLGVLLFASIASAAFSVGSIRLYSYPYLSLADGSSTVTVSAEVHTSGGSLVPDGTDVRFTTTLGSFRDLDAKTSSGVARAILVAPNTAGVAKVTVTVPSVAAVNTFDVEFVSDRSLLTSAHSYLDVTSPESLFYSSELKIISATSSSKDAQLKFKDMTITARDMQVDINQMTVVANDAKLSVGKETLECQFLKYRLNRRRGVAIATIDGHVGGYNLTGVTATLAEDGVLPKEFEFADVGRASTSIHAERIVAFPQREIQFHKARMYVGDTKVMSLGLYALNPNSQNGLFSDQIVGFANGGLQLNYPYYLKLSPDQTSVFRLRGGDEYSHGSNGNRGMFLDWENNYLLGGDGEGSLTLAGIGRNDMGLSWHHSQRFDDKSSANASLDFPGFRGMYGNFNASRTFAGYSATFGASSAHSFQGTKYETQRMDFNMLTDMRKISGLPITQSFGLTAANAQATYGPTHTRQEGYGLRANWLLMPQSFGKNVGLNGGFQVTQLWGNKAAGGLGILGNLGVTASLGANSSLRLNYNYAQDSLNTAITGRHRIGAEFAYDNGKYMLNLFGGKSLDIDSFDLSGEASWQMNSLYRLGTYFSVNRYLKSTINDQTLILARRLGNREFGLTYSINTKHFGFQIFNVPIR